MKLHMLCILISMSEVYMLNFLQLFFSKQQKRPDKIQVLLTPILRQALLATTLTIVRRFAQYELSDYES